MHILFFNPQGNFDDVDSYLTEHPDFGGQLVYVKELAMAMVDAGAVEALDTLNVDTLFISTDGLTVEGGLTTPYRQEAMLKRAMLASARRVVALVDHSKFGKDHFVRFAEWSEVDVLVTTVDADSMTIERIEALGTTVLQA